MCTLKTFFERLKNGGSKLLVGDLVQPDANDNKTVTVVTEENQDQFTLWDIVMTLPGYDVEYSGMVSSKFVGKSVEMVMGGSKGDGPSLVGESGRS